jgi:competence ComEA-like helix-hairpin-helix protein
VHADPDTIDLSSASEEELRQLPGVEPALARRIVAWRSEHGGFGSVDQLTEVMGISSRLVDELRPHVRVDPFTFITAMRDPEPALNGSPMVDAGPPPAPATEIAARPRSPVARLLAFATENVGNAALIAVIALVELFIGVMLVRAL